MTKDIDVGIIIESKESLSCILVNKEVKMQMRSAGELGHEVAMDCAVLD